MPVKLKIRLCLTCLFSVSCVVKAVLKYLDCCHSWINWTFKETITTLRHELENNVVYTVTLENTFPSIKNGARPKTIGKGLLKKTKMQIFESTFFFFTTVNS